MKLTKIIVAAAAGSLFSSFALAQAQVAGQKQQGFKLLMPGLYGKVELRHDTKFKSNEVSGSTPTFSVMPSIGTTLWGKTVDTSFTARYVKATENPTLQTAQFYNETSWSWVKGDFGSVGPYAYTNLDTSNGQVKYSNIGLNFTLEHTYPLAAGDITVNAFTEPKGQLLVSSNPDTKVTPRNDTGRSDLALAAEGEGKVDAKQSIVLNYSGFSVKGAPATLKDLTVGLGVSIYQQWTPRYVATDVVENKIVAESDAYEYRALTISKLTASYKLKEGLSLGGELLQYNGGVYGYSIVPETADANKEFVNVPYQTRVTLTADLF